MSAQNPSKNKRLVTWVAAAGAVLVLVGAQWRAKPQTPTGGDDNSPASRAALATSRDRDNADDAGERLTPQPERLGLAGTPPVRELFRPLIRTVERAPENPMPQTNAPVLPNVTLPEVPTAPPPPLPVMPAPEPPSPTADIQMTGVVELGDEVLVLLKKTSTGESRYFAKGEEAFGFTVGEIKANEVELQRTGETYPIAMSNAVPVEIRGGGSITSGGLSGGSSSSFSRSDDRGRRERGRDGGRESGRDGGVNTSELFNLATWAERLKKLEEIKGQLEPARYERLKQFFQERAQREQQNR